MRLLRSQIQASIDSSFLSYLSLSSHPTYLLHLQEWCAKHPSDNACANDGGSDWAMAPVGSAGSVDDTQWTPKADAVIAGKDSEAGKKYDCACLKKCSCVHSSETKSGKVIKSHSLAARIYIYQIHLKFIFSLQDECTCYADNYKKVWGKASDLDAVLFQTSKATAANKLSCACSCGGISSYST